MKIYIIIGDHRLIDLSVRAYLDREKALDIAKEIAEEYAGYRGREVDFSFWPGCIYHGVYSDQGDSVSVYEKEVEV